MTLRKALDLYLKSLDEAELRAEIKKLYGKLPAVKDYYGLELLDDDAVLERYKKKLRQVYFMVESRLARGRSKEAHALIKSFKQIAVEPKDVAHLILYRVELMLDYQRRRRKGEMYFKSMTNSFREACEIIEREQLQDYFREWCGKLIEGARNISYDVPKTMRELHSAYIVE